MFPQLVTVTVLAAGALAQLTVNTPSAVQCEPVLISWTGGTGPYFLSIVNGNNPTAPALDNLASNLNAMSFTWTVDQAANTNLAVDLRDSSGTLAQSGIFMVQSSSDTSCLNGSSSSSASGGSGSSTSAGASSSGTAKPSGSSSSTSASSTTSSSSSAGERAAAVGSGAAALVVAAFAAVLA